MSDFCCFTFSYNRGRFFFGSFYSMEAGLCIFQAIWADFGVLFDNAVVAAVCYTSQTTSVSSSSCFGCWQFFSHFFIIILWIYNNNIMQRVIVWCFIFAYLRTKAYHPSCEAPRMLDPWGWAQLGLLASLLPSIVLGLFAVRCVLFSRVGMTVSVFFSFAFGDELQPKNDIFILTSC